MMTIFVYVDPTAAIMAGKTSTGYLAVEIDEKFLSILSAEERKLLALHVGNTAKNERKTHIGFFIGFGYKIDAPTLDNIRKALKYEIEKEKELQAQYEQQILTFLNTNENLVEIKTAINEWGCWVEYNCVEISRENYFKIDQEAKNDPRVIEKLLGIEEKERHLNAERKAAAEKELKKKVALQREKEQQAEAEKLQKIEQLLNGEMLARYREGLLPESELVNCIKKHVFGYMLFEKYRKIESTEFNCEDDCEYDHEKSFNTCSCKSLSADEFAHFQKIKEAAPPDTKFILRHHQATCSCGNTIERKGVQLKLDWYGYLLTCEFAL